VVYMAYDMRLQMVQGDRRPTPVALKIFRNGDAYAAAAARETCVLAILNGHPAVPVCYGRFVWKKRFAIQVSQTFALCLFLSGKENCIS